MRAHLARLIMLLSICGPGLPALAAERVGDTLALYAFRDRADVVDAVEEDLLALIEASPAEDRFELYRTYDQLVGAWVQVELSQTLIEEAMAATSPSQEEEIRTTLRDQAQFALWELDEARMDLERNVPSADRWQHLRINEAIRSLLSETRPIFSRLLADR
jgi:hypothetical protein